MRRDWCIIALIVVGLLFSGCSNAPPTVKWVELVVGERTIRVSPGAVLALHPDAPFKLSRVGTDRIFPPKFTFNLEGVGSIQPGQYYTLSELLGEKIYTTSRLKLSISTPRAKNLAQITLLVRLLPIDWLRRAQSVKDPAEKIRAMRQLWQANPDDPLVAKALAELLASNGQLEEAAKVMIPIFEHNPSPALALTIARWLSAAGRHARAVKILSRALSEHPRNPRLLSALAKSYEAQGNWVQAAKAWENLAANAPEQRAVALRRAARAWEQAGDFSKAATNWRKLCEAAPGDWRAWDGLALALANAGQEDHARKALARAAALAPLEPKIRRRLAGRLAALGMKAQAAATLLAAARARPGDAQLWMDTARACQEAGNETCMLEAYQALARLKNPPPEVLYNLGVLLMNRGQPARAAKVLEKALALAPSDQPSAKLLLEALVAAKRWKAAADHALKLLESGVSPSWVVATIYPPMHSTAPKLTTKVLEAAVARGPKDPQVYLVAAAHALTTAGPKAAARVLEKAAKAMPNNITILKHLAEAYEAAGQDDKALKVYGRLADLTDDPAIQDHYLELRTRLLKARHPSGVQD